MTMKMTKAEIEAIAMTAKELVAKFTDAEAKAKAACEAVEAMRPDVEKAIAFMVELGERAETTEKKQPSKLWHITYKYRGVTKELWLARDIYIALNGKYDKAGFVEMVDGIRRGSCIRITQDMIKASGCPEYHGDTFSHWLDEEAVDEATEWMAMRNQHRRKTQNRAYDADAVVQRYAEVHSGKQVAKEFNLSPSVVCKLLKRRGVETPGSGHNRKVTQEMEAEIIRLSKEGLSQAKIARIVGISQKLVCTVLRRNGIGRGLDR